MRRWPMATRRSHATPDPDRALAAFIRAADLGSPSGRKACIREVSLHLAAGTVSADAARELRQQIAAYAEEHRAAGAELPTLVTLAPVRTREDAARFVDGPIHIERGG